MASSQERRCDVCFGVDGWRGSSKLHECSKCGVCVHENCYGIDASSDSWICRPCSAVGSSIEGCVLRRGTLVTLAVTERAHECVLCPISNGTHAMHPLYHYHGKEGRQIILHGSKRRGIKPRLGWVHTACALAVCQNSSTQGCLYGCDQEGRFGGDTDGVLGQFVMCGLNGHHEDEEDFVKALNEAMSKICYLCGRHKTKPGQGLRVLIQCSAGQEEEHWEFAQYHQDSQLEPCQVSMHPGCALWGPKGLGPTKPRHVWFYQGESECIFEAFCEHHAQQTGANSYSLERRVKESGSSGILKLVPDVWMSQECGRLKQVGKEIFVVEEPPGIFKDSEKKKRAMVRVSRRSRLISSSYAAGRYDDGDSPPIKHTRSELDEIDEGSLIKKKAAWMETAARANRFSKVGRPHGAVNQRSKTAARMPSPNTDKCVSFTQPVASLDFCGTPKQERAEPASRTKPKTFTLNSFLSKRYPEYLVATNFPSSVSSGARPQLGMDPNNVEFGASLVGSPTTSNDSSLMFKQSPQQKHCPAERTSSPPEGRCRDAKQHSALTQETPTSPKSRSSDISLRESPTIVERLKRVASVIKRSPQQKPHGAEEKSSPLEDRRPESIPLPPHQIDGSRE